MTTYYDVPTTGLDAYIEEKARAIGPVVTVDIRHDDICPMIGAPSGYVLSTVPDLAGKVCTCKAVQVTLAGGLRPKGGS